MFKNMLFIYGIEAFVEHLNKQKNNTLVKKLIEKLKKINGIDKVNRV